MNDFINLLALLFLGSLSLTALFTALSVLFPKRTGQTSKVADLMPGRATLVGLVNFLFFGAAGLTLLTLAERVGNGLLKIIFLLPALVFLVVLFISLCFGLAGVALLVGQRLAPQRGEVAQVMAGTLVVGWGSALPFVGWFLLLPYIGWLGLGAFIIAFFYRERPPASDIV
jgi:hypothetical protein